MRKKSRSGLVDAGRFLLFSTGLFSLTVSTSKQIDAAVVQWYPSINDIPIEVVDGDFNDPLNWTSGVAPKHLDVVSIKGLTSTGPKNIEITYQNVLQAGEYFSSLETNTVNPSLTVDFLISSDLETISLQIGDTYTFKHTAGQVRATHMTIDGNYELTSPATLEFRPGGTGFFTPIISATGSFTQNGTNLTFDGLDAHGDYTIANATMSTNVMLVGDSLTATNATINAERVSIDGDTPTVTLNNSTFNLLGPLGAFRGITIGGAFDAPTEPTPTSRTMATLRLNSGSLFDTNYETLIGEDFAAQVIQDSTSQFRNTRRTRLGNNAPGTYTLNGGIFQSETLEVGVNAAGEFIQNGGAVVIAQAVLTTEGMYVGSATGSGTYRLNNGTLNARDLYLNGDFFHTNGTVDLSGVLWMQGGSYTHSSGSLDIEETLIVEGSFNYNGGTLTNGNFELRNDGSFAQASALHHQTKGTAEFNGSNWSYSLGANASHAITGNADFTNSNFSTSDLLDPSSTFTVGGLTRLTGTQAIHNIGNMVTGDLELASATTLTQTGGNFGINGSFEVVFGSQWNFSSGIVLHIGQLRLGLDSNGANSSGVHQTGGSLSSSGFDFNQKTSFRAAGGQTSFAGDGIVNGSLTVEPNGDFDVEDISVVTTGTQDAAFTQTGGVFDADAFTGGFDSLSVFEGGTARLDSFDLIDNGRIKVSGASVELSGDADVGDGSSIEVSEGSLTVAGATTLRGSGGLSLTGGTFTTAALLRSPGVAFPTWDTGTMIISGGGSVGPTGSLGNSLSLSDHGPLEIGDTLTVQEGGSLSIGSGAELELNNFLASAGSTVSQTGGSLSTVADFTLNHDTTSSVLLGGGVLQVGNDFSYAFSGAAGGADGLLYIKEDALLDVTGAFIAAGNATVWQRDTSQVAAEGDFCLGAGENEDANYILDSSASLTSGSAKIGGEGRGQFFANGTHTVSGNLSVGSTTAEQSQYRANGLVELGSATVAGLANSAGLFRAASSTTVTGHVGVGDAANANGTLEVRSGMTVFGSLKVGGAGSGLVDQNSGNFEVSGQFHVASGGKYLLSDGNAEAGTFLNEGIFEVPPASGFPRFDAPVTNQGSMEIHDDWRSDELYLTHSNHGTVSLYDGSTWDFSSNNNLTNEAGGIIRGEGGLGGTSFVFHNAGTLQPGNSPGTLSLQATMTSAPTAVMEFELEGPLSTDCDKLIISGRCELAGKLIVNFDGYTPKLNDRFILIDASVELTGAFDTVEVNGLPASLEALPQIDGNDLVLNIAEALLTATDLLVSLPSSSTLPLAWTDPNSATAGYRVRHATHPGGPWVEGADLPSGTTQTTLTGLVAGTTYYLQIQAFTDLRESEWSDAITATTVPAGLASWRFSNFGVETDSGDAANSATPLNDGIPNLIKYALGLDPLNDSVGHPRLPKTTRVDVEIDELADTYFAYTFVTPDPLPEGVTLEVMSGSDLINWNGNAVLLTNDTTTVPGESHQTWRSPSPIDENMKFFFRLKAD